MKTADNKKSSFFMRAPVLAIGMLAAVAFAGDAQAWERSHNGGYTTGKGRTGTYSSHSSGSRGEGYQRNQSVTTDNGKSYERSAAGKCSKDGATANCEKSVTGWRGKTRTSTGQYNKETGAFSGTATGENGKGGSVSGTAAKGQRTGTWTTNSGKTGTFDQSVSHGEGVYNKSTTATNANGQTVNWDTTYDKDSSTLTHTYTNPQGEQRSGTVTFNQ
jgi:hypothetical protein